MSEALAHYRAGRVAECLNLANAALGADPDDREAGLAMGVALGRMGRADDLERLALHFEGRASGGGWALAAETLHALLIEGQYAALHHLHAATPPDSPLHILTVYHDGCARLAEGDMETAIGRFDWFRRHVRFYAGHMAFAAHPLLSMIYRQGRLVAAPEEIETRLTTPDIRPGLEHMGTTDAAPPQVPLLFTCMDDRYFRLLGEAFAEANRALNPDTPLALHVIGPSKESLERLHAMSIRWPGRFAASWEASPLYATVTYYASARYFVAEALMERSERGLLSLDAELSSPVERLGLGQACLDADFACFGTGRLEPGSVWQASVMWFGRGDSSRDFLRALRAYCRPELAHPSLLTWQLDQAALLALKHHFESRGLGLTFLDLRQALGMSLAECVRDIRPPQAKEADKHDKMNAEARNAGAALGLMYQSL